jgi:hypothetical protein
VKGLLQVICLANDVTGFAKSYLFGYCTSSSGFLFLQDFTNGFVFGNGFDLKLYFFYSTLTL